MIILADHINGRKLGENKSWRSLHRQVLGAILASVVATGTTSSFAASTQHEAISGVFHHLTVLDHEPNGAARMVETQLHVDGGSCRVVETGFLTNDVYKCDVTADGKSFTVRFRSYCDGSEENAYGVTLYRQGDPLFSVQPVDEETLSLRWKSLRPSGPQSSGTQSFTRTPGASFEDACLEDS